MSPLLALLLQGQTVAAMHSHQEVQQHVQLLQAELVAVADKQTVFQVCSVNVKRLSINLDNLFFCITYLQQVSIEIKMFILQSSPHEFLLSQLL